MTEQPLNKLRLRGGVAWIKRSGYLLAYDPAEEPKYPHAFLYAWHDGKLSHSWAKFNAHSICRISSPRQAVVIICSEGFYGVFSEMVETGNILVSGQFTPTEYRYGSFRSVTAIDGQAYAVGLRGMVYRYDAANLWSRFDVGLPPDFNIEAIHGYTSTDIYAVGFQGAMWHYSGQRWERIDLPTNVNLTSVHCAQDGYVYAGGHRGMLLKGRDNQWEVLDQNKVKEDLWSINWFENVLYASSLSALYRLDGNQLQAVDFGGDTPRSFYHLSSAEHVLWSIGASDVMAYDGVQWARIF